MPQENFFAPLLAATVVESNIRIGNRYAELFEKLQQNADVEMLEDLVLAAVSEAQQRAGQVAEDDHPQGQLVAGK